MRTYSFEKLDVWQRARKLRVEIYSVAASFPRHEVFGLASQIRRSTSSISDCLAEGSGRSTVKDKAHYLTMAYSTTIETLNHLIGALDLGYISESKYLELRNQIEIITAKIAKLKSSILAGNPDKSLLCHHQPNL